MARTDIQLTDNDFVFKNTIIPTPTTMHPRWNDSTDAAIYGTDRFGFGALPSGNRNPTGTFEFIKERCQVSTIDEYTAGSYEYRTLLYNDSILDIDHFNKQTGFSIRSVRTATTEEQLLPNGLISATYTDHDGNVYQCTKIGLQVWTTLNLKVTRYADGTLIPTNLSDAGWASDTDGASAVYGKNDGAFVPTDELDTESKMVAAYGRLYNWYAIDNAHGLIDTTDGWHVPTDAEFTQLTDYLIATYSDITIDNVGDVLKSVRQVNRATVETDLILGDSDAQHIEDTINANAGWWKENYTDGVGIQKYLKSKNVAELSRSIKIELKKDGYDSSPIITTVNDKLNINPNVSL